MLSSRQKHFRFFAAAFLLAVGSAAAEPLFTLSEDGKTFLYRARPGDHPGVVAEMFGIPTRDVPAFLAANGISDATKVAAGFPMRSAATSISRLVVGSSPKTSSPSGASTIARRISGLGMATVSERKSIAVTRLI